jgi:hypothetical protein
MRTGRIEYSLGYTVDLDNVQMVQHAQDAIIDDVINAVFRQGSEDILAYITAEENPSLNQSDIPDFLLEDEQGDSIDGNKD